MYTHGSLKYLPAAAWIPPSPRHCSCEVVGSPFSFSAKISASDSSPCSAAALPLSSVPWLKAGRRACAGCMLHHAPWGGFTSPCLLWDWYVSLLMPSEIKTLVSPWRPSDAPQDPVPIRGNGESCCVNAHCCSVFQLFPPSLPCLLACLFLWGIEHRTPHTHPSSITDLLLQSLAFLF